MYVFPMVFVVSVFILFYLLDSIFDVLELDKETNTLKRKDGNGEAFGLVNAVLIPGRNISPYFNHNLGNKDSPTRIATNCKTCAKNKNNGICRYSDKNRAITVVTTIQNLNHGLSQKGKIKIKECRFSLIAVFFTTKTPSIYLN